jgi:RNA-directed DNA polymerase
MEETKAPLETTSEDWALLPWRKLERQMYRLQKRIFKASRRGNLQAVHRLQQLLMQSRSARLLAVRRVTQENQGKKTAGVDGGKSLPPPARLALAEAIHPKHWKGRKAPPVRRVWIPKPGKTKKRPLGIPTLRERACQALATQALEPEWEAKCETNSYGFRPGRSAHDAIEAIFKYLRFQEKYILDADMAGCFDAISHSALLCKLNTYPGMRRAIRGWLKAGVMEAGEGAPPNRGTPQGGIISPVLANVALHGMEQAVQAAFKSKEGKPALVRYADDFVVLHTTETGITKARGVIETWLQAMGLELKPSKTRISHSLTPYQGQIGFDFLGFTIRQFPVGRTHTGKNTNGNPPGFKTIITPSQTAIKQHGSDLRKVVQTHRTAPQAALIAKLNPIIRGWANYHRTVVAKRAFSGCDHPVFSMLRSWAQHRHPHKSAEWITRKYCKVKDTSRWNFTAPDGSVLRKHEDAAIRRHVKVKGAASPYDGNLVYWAQRLRDHPLTNTQTGYLLRLQKGPCARCGLYFQDGEVIDADHIIPKSLGGDDRLMNLQLLHRHCHDQKTAQDGSNQARGGQGIHDKDHLAEEPDDRKRSRPVLKTSRVGDNRA